MSAKGKLRTGENGNHSAYCFGCECYHILPNTWQFNGNYDNPSFAPSFKIEGFSNIHNRDFVCHFFILNGEFKYLSDCTHRLANESIKLQDEK